MFTGWGTQTGGRTGRPGALRATTGPRAGSQGGRTGAEVVVSSGAKCDVEPVVPSLGPALGPQVLPLTQGADAGGPGGDASPLQ